MLTTGRVSREDNSCTTGLVAIAKDHGLDIYRCSQIMRNIIQVAVNLSSGVIPRLEDCLDSSIELLFRALGEGLMMLTIKLLILLN